MMKFLYLILLVPWVYFGIIRNTMVARLRSAVLHQISDANHRDIDAHQFGTWQWRFQEFEKVSQFDMLFQFWRPLKLTEWWPVELVLSTKEKQDEYRPFVTAVMKAAHK